MYLKSQHKVFKTNRKELTWVIK
ncbi:MAG: hypothetical protein HOD92_15900 [Deltaproteobacteria bacterium]|nr:hypothetical protein [Deltaproteobacteria bacterium]